VGWTVQFTAVGSLVTFNFPPITLLPTDNWFYPALPVMIQQVQPLSVVPGVQPDLPTSGSVADIIFDNSSSGGVVVNDYNLGSFTVNFAAADTTTLQPQTFSWWFRRIDSGHNDVLKWGSAVLLPSPASY
jgi:hypothetical protein